MSKTVSPLRSSRLPNEIKQAISNLDLAGFRRCLSRFPNKKQKAWEVIWDHAFHHADAGFLDALARSSTQLPDYPTSLSKAAWASNHHAVKWMLENKDSWPVPVPYKSLFPDMVKDKEEEVVACLLSDLIVNNSHTANPIHKVLAVFLEAYPRVFRLNGTPVKFGSCLSSAYEHGDLDDLATLLRVEQDTYIFGNARSHTWVLGFLEDASFSQVQQLLKFQKEHADFSRQWSSLFPMHLTPSRTNNVVFRVENSWEAILLLGGKSVYPLLSKPKSPLLPSAIKILEDRDCFGSFLANMSRSPGNLARALSHGKIRELFFSWKGATGENSLHLLIRNMPHHTLRPRWGSLTSWLDKNAPHMFDQPFGSGESVDEVLREHAPVWFAKRRRKALGSIVSRTTPTLSSSSARTVPRL